MNTSEAAIRNDRLAQVNVVCFHRNPSLEFLILKRNSKKEGSANSYRGVKVGEELLDTVSRELIEELAITVDQKRIIQTDYSFSFMGTEGYELTEYVFGYELSLSDEVIRSSEHTEQQFLGLEEAKALLKFDTNKVALDRVASSLLLLKSL